MTTMTLRLDPPGPVDRICELTRGLDVVFDVVRREGAAVTIELAGPAAHLRVVVLRHAGDDEVTPDVLRAFDLWLTRQLGDTEWTHCGSWRLHQHHPRRLVNGDILVTCPGTPLLGDDEDDENRGGVAA